MATVTIELRQDPQVGDLVTVVTPQEHPFAGAAFQVVSVELPYVVLHLLAGSHQGQAFSADLREVALMRVSAQFVAALRNPLAVTIPVEQPVVP